MYESKFNPDDGWPALTVKFVPENCTDVAQPLDTYFHRELKYLSKQFYHYNALCHKNEVQAKLFSRNGILKLIALAHFLLSAPSFIPMIKYCWYSSGLWIGDDKPTFANVKSVCFTYSGIQCVLPSCEGLFFIKCSWCQNSYCFKDFYDKNHMNLCDVGPYHT